MPKFRRATARKGFTLIELMIVVAIIGLLSAIAIPSFLRFQLKSKSSEGKTNLAAIRTSQQSHYSEFGFYVSASPSPAATLLNLKTTFTNADGPDDGFDQLGWQPEGLVLFNYSVATSASGNAYTAAAGADIDADTNPQTWGYKKGAAADIPAAEDHGVTGGQCNEANLMFEVVGPCDASSGHSVF